MAGTCTRKDAVRDMTPSARGCEECLRLARVARLDGSRQHLDDALFDSAMGLLFILLPACEGGKPAFRTPFGYLREGFSGCL
jgi:hypothetical protein